MAEVFGDRGDFAIEAGIERDGHTAGTVWGHMCVWCQGIALGDIDERYCALFPAYDHFHWLADHHDCLWADELTGLDDQALWNFLDGLLYGYHGDIELQDQRTLEECRRDWDLWGRFRFLDYGEQFDGYKSFLLSPPGEMARLLSRRLPEKMGVGVAVTKKGLQKAASAFAHWFECESRQFGVTCFPSHDYH